MEGRSGTQTREIAAAPYDADQVLYRQIILYRYYSNVVNINVQAALNLYIALIIEVLS